MLEDEGERKSYTNLLGFIMDDENNMLLLTGRDYIIANV
jgi:hypothetical protein